MKSDVNDMKVIQAENHDKNMEKHDTTVSLIQMLLDSNTQKNADARKSINRPKPVRSQIPSKPTKQIGKKQ